MNYQLTVTQQRAENVQTLLETMQAMEAAGVYGAGECLRGAVEALMTLGVGVDLDPEGTVLTFPDAADQDAS